MATKKKPKGKAKAPAKATVSKLEPVIDFGTPPDPNSAAVLASDVLTRFLFHGEFPDNPSPTLVRFLAMMTYTTDPQAPSINEIAQMPFFVKHASLPKLMHWSAEDGWVTRRLKTWETWHERIVEASAQQYVAFRTKALNSLDKIRDRITKVIDARLEADQLGSDSKSHELVRSLTQLIKAEQELHEMSPTSRGDKGDAPTGGTRPQGQTIMGELGAPTVNADGSPELDTSKPIDATEARAAAHAVLELRRAALSKPAAPAAPITGEKA